MFWIGKIDRSLQFGGGSVAQIYLEGIDGDGIAAPVGLRRKRELIGLPGNGAAETAFVARAGKLG